VACGHDRQRRADAYRRFDSFDIFGDSVQVRGERSAFDSRQFFGIHGSRIGIRIDVARVRYSRSVRNDDVLVVYERNIQF